MLSTITSSGASSASGAFDSRWVHSKSSTQSLTPFAPSGQLEEVSQELLRQIAVRYARINNLTIGIARPFLGLSYEANTNGVFANSYLIMTWVSEDRATRERQIGTQAAAAPRESSAASADSLTPNARALILEILKKRFETDLQGQSAVYAQAAVNDAETVMQRNSLGGKPAIRFSEDGILSLQWRKGERGVALLFAGDGVVSISIKRPGHLYSENGIDVVVETQLLPQVFNEALAAVLV